jgi:type IV pilus assembly protein PilE
MMRRKLQGFTLIELMIVVVIIGLLASVAIPSYQNTIQQARRAEAKSALHQLMLSQELFYTEQQRYFTLTPTADIKEVKWFSGSTPQTSFYALSAQACDHHDLQTCILLSAIPGHALVNTAYSDPLCQTLTLNSQGLRGAAGKVLPDAPSICWQ